MEAITSGYFYFCVMLDLFFFCQIDMKQSGVRRVIKIYALPLVYFLIAK